ncbi:PH domain-containing protein [Streptomyces endophytica]|uniref:PH domain-containing protein n=1 Tax=Streptomyces endophytica TaxID=2991496 RepID=A0ABY6PHL2_9ACTN|nr:PH domain-containing protein [Streptomyces endophytica]UZJ33368.1 PH domain-containing protein [Streptomyces endophytica]
MSSSHPARPMPWNHPSHPPRWRRLDPRTLLVHCGWMAAPLGSLALTALATGGRISARGWITLAVIAASFAVVTTLGLIRWARTEFRVSLDGGADAAGHTTARPDPAGGAAPTRYAATLDIRSGLFNRRLRSIPLHRIRTVDLTASPLHRLLGVTVLRAGTAGSGEGGGALSLDALAAPEAARLRAELLARAGSAAADGDPVLARVDWRWLRYAPLTFWVVGGVFAAAGSVYRVLDGIGIEPWKLGIVRQAFAEFGTSALWVTVPVALLAVLALGSVGAVALYVENWWNYRLEWTDGRTLQVRRGLFTTRSVAIERARLRGVLLREPLMLRAGGGALVRAVAGGLGNREENRKRSGLLPPAPRAEALRVAAGALRTPLPAAPASLTPHPRAALRRRRVRGMLCVVLPGTALLAGLGAALTPVLLHCAWVFAVVATPLVLWLARDAYRSLGHGLQGGFLVARSGTFSRDTLVLQRSAIAAWTFTDSPFTRRSGLVTLTAAVAAGEDGYRVRDLAAGEAAGFAAVAGPGVLAEFLVPAGQSTVDPVDSRTFPGSSGRTQQG